MDNRGNSTSRGQTRRRQADAFLEARFDALLDSDRDGVVRDISPQRQTEEELRHERGLLRESELTLRERERWRALPVRHEGDHPGAGGQGPGHGAEREEEEGGGRKDD